MEDKDTEMRFGILAVKKGMVEIDQVVKALEVQVREDLALGKRRRIGMILLEQGAINSQQIDEVVNELEKEGLKLG